MQSKEATVIEPEEHKPGYKKTKLGWIPEDWEVFHLKEIAEFQSGFAFKSEYFSDKGTKLVIPKNFTKSGYGLFSNENIKRTSEEPDEKYICSEGDLLVLLTDLTPSCELLGKPLLLRKEDGTVLLNQRIVKVKTTGAVNKGFLHKWLLSSKYRGWIKSTASGSTVRHSSNKSLGLALIPFPPLPEQRAIANILSTWDEAIQTTDSLIAEKEKLKKGLMQQLLTGKKRLPGFEGEWRRIPAGKVFRNISKKNHPSEPLLSVTQDYGVIPRNLLEARVTMPKGDVTNFKLVEPGNFVISLRSFQGGLEHSDFRGIVSPAYTVIQSSIESSNDFYRHYFKSHDFIGRLAVAVIGIRDGKQISYSDFKNIKIPYPPIKEQLAIAEIINSLEESTNQLKQQHDNYKRLKKGLMQELLTGKTRVTHLD